MGRTALIFGGIVVALAAIWFFFIRGRGGLGQPPAAPPAPPQSTSSKVTNVLAGACKATLGIAKVPGVSGLCGIGAKTEVAIAKGAATAAVDVAHVSVAGAKAVASAGGWAASTTASGAKTIVNGVGAGAKAVGHAASSVGHAIASIF